MEEEEDGAFLLLFSTVDEYTRTLTKCVRGTARVERPAQN